MFGVLLFMGFCRGHVDEEEVSTILSECVGWRSQVAKKHRDGPSCRKALKFLL